MIHPYVYHQCGSLAHTIWVSILVIRVVIVVMPKMEKSGGKVVEKRCGQATRVTRAGASTNSSVLAVVSVVDGVASVVHGVA